MDIVLGLCVVGLVALLVFTIIEFVKIIGFGFVGLAIICFTEIIAEIALIILCLKIMIYGI